MRRSIGEFILKAILSVSIPGIEGGYILELFPLSDMVEELVSK